MRFRLLATMLVSFLPLIAAGCYAMAGDSAALADPTIALRWDTLITIYGPMAGIIAWFMWREKIAQKAEATRTDTLISLVGDCTATITSVNATLVQLRAESEKNRNALYRLADEVHDFKGGTGGSNTRTMERHN